MKLDAIRRLIDEATPGPWTAVHSYVRFPCYRSPMGYDEMQVDNCDGLCSPTARFIAAARTLMPKAIAAVDEAKHAMEVIGERLPHGDEAHRTWLAAELAFLFSPFHRALAALEADE